MPPKYFIGIHPNARGNLELTRIDYHPSLWRTIARNSALVRYLTLNTDLLNFFLKLKYLPFGRPSNDASFVGNTSASVDWNSLGHEICFEAIRQSAVYTWFRTLSNGDRATARPASLTLPHL